MNRCAPNWLAGTLAMTLLGGCATLGGNVEGDFSCRAPQGSCAPTSLIDAEATGQSPHSASAGPVSSIPRVPGARSLRIVLAAYRDEAGREHEPRVVHVALPEPANAAWRAPASTGDILRAIARAVADGDEPAATPDPVPTPQMPDVLFIPSQPDPVLSGANAPEPGAPGRNASPGRVPHPILDEGDSQ